MAVQRSQVMCQSNSGGTTTTSVASSPVVAADGVVFVGSNDGFLYAYTDGQTLRWRREVGGLVGSPILSGGLKTSQQLFVGSSNGHVLAFNVDRAWLAWDVDMLAPVSDPPVLAGNALYVTSFLGRVVSISVSDGHLLWDVRLGGQQLSAPALHDELMYVSSVDGQLSALNLGDGTTSWAVSMSSVPMTRPAVDIVGSLLHVGSNEGTVFAVRIASPAPPPPAAAQLSPAVVIVPSVVGGVLIVILAIYFLKQWMRRKPLSEGTSDGAQIEWTPDNVQGQ